MFRRLTKGMPGLALLAMAGHAAPAKAAPITYDEAIDGDLDLSLPPFVLGLGDNVFTGTTSFFLSFSSFALVVDDDRFLFTIQPNLQLSSVMLTVTSFFNNSDSTVSLAFDASTEVRTGVTDDGIAGTPSTLVFSTNDPPVSLPLSLAIPEAELGLGAGLYRAQVGLGAGSIGPGVRDYGYDYTLTLGVTPIPLPAGVWLLISGLGALAAMRARRAA